MEKAELGKKQYWILLAISFAVSFVLPIIVGLGSYYAINRLSNSLSNIAFSAAEIFSAINLAVLIYAAQRCRFVRCLPFVAGCILEYLAMSTFSLVFINSVEITGNTVTYLLFELFFLYAPLFVYICMAGALTRKTKNEVAIVLLTLLGILVVSMLAWKLSDISERIFFPNDGGGNLTQQSASAFLHRILYELRECVSAAVAYLIIKLLFEKSARTGLILYFRKITRAVKKLWDVTAK